LLAGAAGFDAILNPSKSHVLVCFAKLRTLGCKRATGTFADASPLVGLRILLRGGF
jgi:hypothetical protein